MIKALIFDNGGVIAGDAWLEFINIIEKKYGAGPGTISAEIRAAEVLATVGKISFESLAEQISTLTNSAEDLDILCKTKPLDLELIEYIKGLSKSYQVALLTNDLSTFDRDNKVWQLGDVFGANIFCSSRLGIRKPDPMIYKITLDALKVKAAEAVFIDDKERNTKAADIIGMHTILFKSPEQFKNELEYILDGGSRCI